MPAVPALPQRWVLPLSIAALVIPLFIAEYQALTYTKGVITYSLDDAFIHMGIARNLAEHQVWGVTPYNFVSASSSILYPLLLAAFFVVGGPNTLVPLLINLIAGLVLIVMMQRWLKKMHILPACQLLILLVVIFLTPLPPLIICGMEHTVQIVVCMLFIYTFSEWSSKNIDAGVKNWPVSVMLFVSAVLVTAIRYEGMFLILAACLLLFYFRQWELGFELGVIGMLPIIIFGIYSMYKGNYFLPNSVLMKSTDTPIGSSGIVNFFTSEIFEKMYYATPSRGNVSVQRLLIIQPLVLLVFYKQLKGELLLRNFLVLLISVTFLQSVFSNADWFYRYEAYLVTLSVFIIGIIVAKFGKQAIRGKERFMRLTALCVACLLVFPLLIRSKFAIQRTEQACKDIYLQNYHMGLFLHKYYDTAHIAINDLGCLSYYTSAKITDLVGLGSIDVARMKMNDSYSVNDMDRLTKENKVSIAVVFEGIYAPQLLRRWRRVATWHIENAVIPLHDNQSFYAVDTVVAEDLKKNLQAFEKELPSGVRVIY